jgi:hypothetical protein
LLLLLNSFYPLTEGDALIEDEGLELTDVLTEGVLLIEELIEAEGVPDADALTEGLALVDSEVLGVELIDADGEELIEALMDDVVSTSSSDLKPFSVTLKPSIVYENCPASSALKYILLPIPQGKGIVNLILSFAT